MLIHPAAGLRVEVPSLSDHCFRDPFTEFSGSELAVGVRQLQAQRPRCVQSPGGGHRGDAARQTDLFGNAAANLGGMHLSGQLLSDLRLRSSACCPSLDRIARIAGVANTTATRHVEQIAQPREVPERLLQKVHLKLGLVLDQVVTGRAIPSDLEASAALRMARCFTGKRVTRSPLRE